MLSRFFSQLVVAWSNVVVLKKKYFSLVVYLGLQLEYFILYNLAYSWPIGMETNLIIKAQRVNTLDKVLAKILIVFLPNYSALDDVESLRGWSMHTEKHNFRMHIFKWLGEDVLIIIGFYGHYCWHQPKECCFGVSNIFVLSFMLTLSSQSSTVD